LVGTVIHELFLVGMSGVGRTAGQFVCGGSDYCGPMLSEWTTGLVTTECSAPESTMNIAGWPPAFILPMGSWGASGEKPGLP
jgi:hypothetical protein